MNSTLSVQALLPYLSKDICIKKVHIYDSLESTNKTAREMASSGCPHGVIVIADSQTAGKGRYGRSFYSPSGTGLYMSIVLRPKFIDIPSITLITSATAVAVCKAIESVSEQKTHIKWVNDILIDGRKICGILAESSAYSEKEGVEWVVVGIGINIDTLDFPEELTDIASSVFSGRTDGSVRNKLAAKIINTLLVSNDWLNDKNTYNEYKQRMTLLNQKVTVITANESFEAIALDIDTTGRLVVKKSDGSIIALSSGEISLRKC